MELFYRSPFLGQLEYKEYLMYYDQPLLFTLNDKINNLFLGMLAYDEDDIKKWIIVQVTQNRLKNLKHGQLSVYDAFTKPENNFFMVEYVNGHYSEKAIDMSLPEEYLPDTDLFLHCNDDTDEDNAFMESASKERRSVMDVRIINKERPDEHEIPLFVYAPLLQQINNMINVNLRNSMEKFKGYSYAALKAQSQLNLSLHAAGSFVVRLKSNELATIDNSNVVLDSIFNEFYSLVGEDSNKFNDLIKKRNSKVINSFRKLLKEINNDSFDYEFKTATPNRQINKVYINKNTIKERLYKINNYLENKEELYEYSGYLVGGRLESNRFEFVTEDKEKIVGKIDKNALANKQLILSEDRLIKVKIKMTMTANEDLEDFKESFLLVEIHY